MLGNIRNFIPDYIEAYQGYGICVRDPSALRRLWVKERDSISPQSDRPGSDFELCFEVINAMPGLYLGSRDTEPRLVVVGRIKVGSPDTVERYVNFVNVHLTTLRGERQGNLQINNAATRIRLQQLNILTNHTISAYHAANEYRVPQPQERSSKDVWILGGDFNALPVSDEIRLLKGNFVDGNKDKRIMDKDPSSAYCDRKGTKWSLERPNERPMVVDYIFCGLKLDSIDPEQLDITDSQRPFRPQFDKTDFASDHAVLFASFKI